MTSSYKVLSHFFESTIAQDEMTGPVQRKFGIRGAFTTVWFTEVIFKLWPLSWDMDLFCQPFFIFGQNERMKFLLWEPPESKKNAIKCSVSPFSNRCSSSKVFLVMNMCTWTIFIKHNRWKSLLTRSVQLFRTRRHSRVHATKNYVPTSDRCV